MDISNIKFDNNGLVPAVIQDHETNEVLMVAYMNEESLKRSIETKKTHFYSRSRKKIWMKGEESGHTQTIREFRIDCDNDTLLFKVDQKVAACHTGHKTCFYTKIDNNMEIIEDDSISFDPVKTYNKAKILYKLYDIVTDRRDNPKEGSYTNYLFEKGIDKMLKKVGEESAEVIIAAKNRVKSEVTYEASDLLYHLIVVLVEQGVTLDDIFDELNKRR